MTLSQAEAGRGGGAAGGQGNGGVQAPTGVDLSWCRGKNHCVEIQLSNTPGRPGKLNVYSLNSEGTAYNPSLRNCDAIGGLDSHPDGQLSKKTPAGVHSVIDTGDRLLYNGREINMTDPTYFHDPDLLNIRTSNRMAIHSGFGTVGGNSHGCVRTTASCADSVRRMADENHSEMKIKIVYNR
jgi:hypothetical protein